MVTVMFFTRTFGRNHQLNRRVRWIRTNESFSSMSSDGATVYLTDETIRPEVPSSFAWTKADANRQNETRRRFTNFQSDRSIFESTKTRLMPVDDETVEKAKRRNEENQNEKFLEHFVFTLKVESIELFIVGGFPKRNERKREKKERQKRRREEKQN